MTPFELWISFYTMVRKDVVRMFRIWVQTFLPNVITSTLYFLVFGSFLGAHIGDLAGVPYVAFVVPGLVMLAIVTSSYANTSFMFFTSKFFARSIDEILVSPTPPSLLIAGFIAGGIVRGVLVGILVLFVSVFFTQLSVFSIGVTLLFGVLTALIFSLAGLVNGIYAKTIDGINIIPTFVLTPLVYLGGVFYTLETIPQFWQKLTFLNPIFYLVSGFRYGLLGIGDVSLVVSIGVLVALATLLVAINWYFIRTGLGLKQ
jgi:ABC-2 type transport system permease protein